MADQLSTDLASLRIQRDVPPNRRTALRYVIGAVLGVIGLGAAYIVGAPYLEARVFRPEVGTTEMVLLSPAQSSVELTASGYVIAENKSRVSAKVPGRIAKLYVQEGDTVKAGDLIADLEDTDQQSAIRASKARVFAARARVGQAKAATAEARAQAQRQRVLVEKGATAKATADDLELHVHALEETVRAQEAEVASAEAEVASLMIMLKNMRVTSPISGRVVEKISSVGELVGIMGATPIVELADFDSLIIQVDVAEGRLHRVKPGAPCEAVLDAYPSTRYRCVAYEVVPRVNRSKATVPVKVKFVDPHEGAIPDMSARVSFLQKELDAEAMKDPPKLIVPASALVERNGSKVVFVLDGDQVRMMPVTLGPAFGSGFEVKEGPPSGTKLVKNPPESLSDGRRIKERNE